MIGCDFSLSRPSVAALRQGGFGFVGRYADGRPAFDISHSEAAGYLQARIDVIVFCEPGSGDWMLRAGETGGVEAAAIADEGARAAGLPGVPVFFGADWDVQPDELPVVDAVLRGAAAKIGPARTGIYGGLRVVSHCLTAGSARFACQTMAWSGGLWDARVHVRQYGSFTLDGASCDHLVAMKPDFGQFPRPASHSPYRHVADGSHSLADIAAARNTTPAHLLGVSAAHYTPADLAEAEHLALPHGWPYYTSNP